MEGLKQIVCKSCGQPLVRQGNNYTCNYCGNVWVADLADDIHAVQRANAWEALRVGDFEKATELFDDILLKNNNDHEAYWGKALSLNAILYVVDINEHKRVPTCNNITESSFLNHKDVIKAISLAPSEISESYKKQAEYIEKVRVEWLEVARKEPEYDVFISFKDSDRENGLTRTHDSVDAQELYNLLTAEGLNVFFSRISLKNKLSEKYEPYIYNAIKTAKVMIVFGEKAEYFSSPWIKNEWRRYLSRIEKGEKHKNSLVVVYKNLDVSELPKVLSSRQCLNADDMSFSTILLRHIRSTIELQKKNEKLDRIEIKGEQISKKATTLNTNQLKTREIGANKAKSNINDKQKLGLVDTYLKAQMFAEAEKLLNEVLVENPESSEANFKALQIKYKRKKPTSINDGDIAMLERAIVNGDKKQSGDLLNHLYEVVIDDNYYAELLNLILPFEYDNRPNQIEKAFNRAIEGDKYKSFCVLLKTLHSDEVDRYIDYNLRFAEKTVDTMSKIRCIYNVLSVDKGNVIALRDLFFIKLEQNDNVKAKELFEEVLKYSSDPESEIAFLLGHLYDNYKVSYCGWVKTVLQYSRDNSIHRKEVLQIVKKAVKAGDFAEAEELISLIVSENETSANIYWTLCLIKTKSKNDKEILKSDISLKSLPEFQSYLIYSSDSNRERTLELAIEQADAIAERRKKEQEKARAEQAKLAKQREKEEEAAKLAAKKKAMADERERTRLELLAQKKAREEEAIKQAEDEKRRIKRKRVTKVIITFILIIAIAFGGYYFFSKELPKIFLQNGYYGYYVKLGRVSEFTIPEGVTEIEREEFKDCDSLKSIVIPRSVTVIGEGAFSGCDSLSSVVISDSVTTIGDDAFFGCDSLSSVVIPNGVTTIGNTAFYLCSSLSSVKIGSNVTLIGEAAFGHCYSLISISVSEYNGNYCSLNGNLYNKNKTTLIQYAIGKNDKSFIIPESVTKIDYGAFSTCDSLSSVIIPDSVTSIRGYSFNECDNLTIYCEAKSKPSSWNNAWNASNCPVYWYSSSKPTKSGNYWHYVDGTPKIW